MNAAFAVGSYNYTPFIKAVSDSFLAQHPDWTFYYFLLDHFSMKKEIEGQGFTVVPISKINLPDMKDMTNRYTVLELSTAVKPWCFEYLFKQHEKVLFFDGDIEVVSPMTEVITLLDKYSVVLTPHLLTPYPDDGLRHDHLAISRAGTFNLGFLACSNHPDARKIMNFWKNELYQRCYMNLEKGMHVDQKWMEFVPSLIDSYYILKNPAYNMAYWNLHERKLIDKKFVEFGGDPFPLVFYHFSGLPFDNMDVLSKHQNRYTLTQRPELKGMFEAYKQRVYAAGYEKFQKIPYEHVKKEKVVRVVPALKSEPELQHGGLNIFGYLNENFGIGNVPKYFISMLKKNRMPYALRTITAGGRDQATDHPGYKDSKILPYYINLFFVNADCISTIKKTLDNSVHKNKYNIGVWFWELEFFPEYFWQAFKELDEIWVFSDFIYEHLKLISPIPVHKINIPYKDKGNGKKTTNDIFTYLVVFDYLSDFHRKNPMGAVEAFQRAFPKDKDVQLVIKSSNSSRFPDLHKQLQKIAKKDARVKLIDQHLPEKEFNELFNSADCYVSLHRAEGLGFNIFDAIYKGIPAIISNYGGDIKGWNYPYKVNGKMVKTDTNYIVYQNKNAYWLDPDMDEAVLYMKLIRQNPALAAEITTPMKQSLMTKHNDYSKIGEWVKRRLQAIEKFQIVAKQKSLTDEEKLEILTQQVKNKKVLLFQTGSPEFISRIVQTLIGRTNIHLLTKNISQLKGVANQTFIYPHDGPILEEHIPRQTLKEMKNQKYDLVLIPFHNFNNTISTYENVLDLAKKLTSINNIIGLSMKNELYNIDFDSYEVSLIR